MRALSCSPPSTRQWEDRLMVLGNGGGKADLVCSSFVSYENENFGVMSKKGYECKFKVI